MTITIKQSHLMTALAITLLFVSMAICYHTDERGYVMIVPLLSMMSGGLMAFAREIDE